MSKGKDCVGQEKGGKGRREGVSQDERLGDAGPHSAPEGNPLRLITGATGSRLARPRLEAPTLFEADTGDWVSRA